MIPVSCSCGARYRVPDDKAGLTFTCKKCRQPVAVQAKEDAAAGGDLFLEALSQLEQNAPETIREMDRKEFKKLSKDAAERKRLEEEAQEAKLQEMSRLAMPSVPGARRAPASKVTQTGSPGRTAVAGTLGSGKIASAMQSMGSELGRAVLSRLFLHPAIVCGFVAYTIHSQASNAVWDVEFHSNAEPAYTSMATPQYERLGLMLLWISVFIALSWAIRGWGRVSMFPTTVKAYCVCTTVYLWAAAACMYFWPRGSHGTESELLAMMYWTAFGVCVLMVLWTLLLVVAEDGALRCLAAIFTPYGFFSMFFGRPAGRMGIITVLGAASVVMGLTSLAMLHSSQYPSLRVAIKEENRKRGAAIAANAQRQLEAYQGYHAAEKLRREQEQLQRNSVPKAVPLPPPPRLELKRVDGNKGDAAINSLPVGRFVHTDREVSLLGDYVAEGAFEFRPPKGFERHTLPANPKAIRWDAKGVKPGENSLLIATYRRQPGQSIDGFFASNGSSFQFTRDGSPMNMDHRDGCRFDHNNLTLLRFMPQGASINAQGWTFFHAFVVDQDHIIHLQASTKPEEYFENRKLLEASITTIRRRP